MEILKLIIYFFIYSLAGWILESVYKTIYEKKIVNSGFLHGPLCPIYGVGALMMILFLTSFKDNILLLFIVAVIILSIWEYFVGWLLEKLFHTKYWDYSDKKINIKGRVCLANSIIWGVLGVIFISFIHENVEKIIYKFPINILIIVDSVLAILFIIDTTISVLKVTSINKGLENIKEIGESLKEKIEELKELNTLKELKELKDSATEKIKDITENTTEKIKDITGNTAYKINDVKENIEDKIKSIEKTIEDLKFRQDGWKAEVYKTAGRLKKAFPTMKSEKISSFLEQKVDVKKIKAQRKFRKQVKK